MWLDGDFEWHQDDSSYKVVRFRDKPVSETWSENQLFDAVGAARDAKGAGYPSDFKFSPYDKSELEPAEAVFASSLPPYAQVPAEDNRLGYPETAHDIEIAGIENGGVKPRSLPLPSKGRHHFLVGNFGLKRPFLLSVDLASGGGYCWIDGDTAGTGRWMAIRPEDKISLAAFTCPDISWSMHASSLKQSGVMYFPTDIGLARIEVNVLSLSYTVRYIAPEKPCLSGVIHFNDTVCCLIQDGEAVRILSVPDSGAPESFYDIDGLMTSKGLGIVRLPFIARRDVYWLCEAGQIHLTQKPTTGDHQAKITPWPSKMTPCLLLGAPYESSDGATWFQCFDQNINQYCFILLGDRRDERRVPRSRLLAAKSFFELGSSTRQYGAPWEQVGESSMAVGGLVAPLIESTFGKQCMIFWKPREWKKKFDPREFFDNTKGAIPVGFQLIGHVSGAENRVSQDFFDDCVVTPWDTRVVIYDNVLYLYDPDASSGKVTGWVLESHRSRST